MHDLRSIRENPDAFDAGLARRGAEPAAARILGIDERRRAVTTRVQEAQARRNEASKAIGAAMGNVIYARFADLARENRSVTPLLLRSTAALLLLTPPILAATWFAPTVFAFVFGEEWRGAGVESHPCVDLGAFFRCRFVADGRVHDVRRTVRCARSRPGASIRVWSVQHAVTGGQIAYDQGRRHEAEGRRQA